jgi:hypothetical protein
VRVLRRRLADYLESEKMEQYGDREIFRQASLLMYWTQMRGPLRPVLGKNPKVVVELVRPRSLLTCCGELCL